MNGFFYEHKRILTKGRLGIGYRELVIGFYQLTKHACVVFVGTACIRTNVVWEECRLGVRQTPRLCLSFPGIPE